MIELTPDPPFAYRPLGDPEEVQEHALRLEILRVLPLHAEDALSGDDVQDLVGARRIDVLRVLRQLMTDSLVVRVGSGKRGDAFRYHQAPGVDDD